MSTNQHDPRASKPVGGQPIVLGLLVTTAAMTYAMWVSRWRWRLPSVPRDGPAQATAESLIMAGLVAALVGGMMALRGLEGSDGPRRARRLVVCVIGLALLGVVAAGLLGAGIALLIGDLLR